MNRHAHTSAVFNHSCLKVPINPVNKLPAPTYEQKYLNQLKNQALKLNVDNNNKDSNNMKAKNDNKESLIDFYDSIPDYSDINHLSNQEFYKKIEHLKAKQKSYYEYLEAELNLDNKVDNFIDDYKRQASGERTSSRKSDNLNNIWELKCKEAPETESISSLDKETSSRAPPSRRSVRIESPKSEIESLKFRSKSHIRNVSSADSRDSRKSAYSNLDNAWDSIVDKTNEYHNSSTKSLPSSPVKNKPSIGWKDCGITIPKPFQMTVR